MTPTCSRLAVLPAAFVLAVALGGPARAEGFQFQEAPELAEKVKKGELPPVAERLPRTPLIADFQSRGRQIGRYGGNLRTLAAKARDLRYMTVNAYTRLVGYDEKIELKPDLLEKVENEGNRVFTFTLRDGHKWSDGQPFTTEDFRYYWEDVANNKDLSPSGPPEVYFVDGKPPKVEILDARRIRYSWDAPNPRFLPALAQPQPLHTFAPAHYLKKFHKKYGKKDDIDKAIAKAKVKSWATLHNRLDASYDASNPDLPVLTAWRVETTAPANRFVFERNPYFHRVDPEGRQLPYVDRVVVDIAAGSLFAAKANAGEVDLMGRGLSMADVPVLKEGEAMQGYKTDLWKLARGSAYALFPNLTTNDPVWRNLNRDVRFRRALSAAIDRRILNNALLFGLGTEGNNTIMPQSPLYNDRFRTENAQFDPDLANKLLDEIGLTGRDSSGFRQLPDGRTLEIVVEVDGESSDIIDALQLVTEFWRDVGIKLFAKPQERSILRQRAWSGQTVMVASTGLDNAIPVPEMPPRELAPVMQEHYSWPKWGQWYETRGKNGEEPDVPEAKKLLALYEEWLKTTDPEEAGRIWTDMLALNAAQQFSIGTVAGELQPMVRNAKLRNVPHEALYSWEPTSLAGVYRIEEFWFDR
jgi:peptide/nickel transport system substrate-binding protein